MEELIEKVVKRILRIKYPVVNDVEVTKERKYNTDNFKYNIFLFINQEDYIPLYESEEWVIVKNLVKESVGIIGGINNFGIYVEFND